MDLLSKLPMLDTKSEVDDDFGEAVAERARALQAAGPDEYPSGYYEHLAREQITEEREAEVKKERIKFHRLHVRNGPAKFRTTTNGQVRRARRRAAKREQKRAYKEQVRNHLSTRMLASVTAGQLRLAGVLPYVHERELDRVQQVRSTVWIVQRFGTENDEGDPSFLLDDVKQALLNALKFYGQAYRLGEQALPEGYVVPIYEIPDAGVVAAHEKGAIS